MDSSPLRHLGSSNPVLYGNPGHGRSLPSIYFIWIVISFAVLLFLSGSARSELKRDFAFDCARDPRDISLNQDHLQFSELTS